jgi:hypothetical protein
MLNREAIAQQLVTPARSPPGAEPADTQDDPQLPLFDI